MSPGADHETLRIKKYPNRRFYDVTRSRHVTLEELHRLVREGYEITVMDSKTGDDITNIVLTQIILEFDALKMEIFPAKLLHQTIQTNQDFVRRFVDEYFAKAVDAFAASRKQFEAFLEQTGLHALTPVTPYDWAKSIMQVFRLPAVEQGPESTKSAPTPPDDSVETLRAELHSLSQELANLKTQLRKPKAKPRKQATGAKRKRGPAK